MLLWRLGMPVITSATPAYQRCMQAAGLDLACESTSDWLRALEKLLATSEARKSAAQAGRAYVNTSCNTTVLVERWDRVLSELQESRSGAQLLVPTSGATGHGCVITALPPRPFA